MWYILFCTNFCSEAFPVGICISIHNFTYSSVQISYCSSLVSCVKWSRSCVKSSRFWIFVSFSIALQSKNTMNYHKDYKQINYSMNPQAPKEEWGTFIVVVHVCDQSPYWAVWRRWLAWRKSRLKKICIRKIIMNVKFSVH